MQKVKDFFKNNKNSPFIKIGIILLVIIIGAIIIFFFGSIFKNNNRREEKILTRNLEDIGREFYEQKYQPQMSEEVLKKFTDIGIKFNLSGLTRVNLEENSKKVSSFKNTKTNKKCDGENSMVIIYPQEPFGQKDYRIEVRLDCGFNKKKN